MSPVAAFLIMGLPAIVVALAAAALLLAKGEGRLLPAAIEDDEAEQISP